MGYGGDDLGSDGAARQIRFTIDAPGADRVLASIDGDGAEEQIGTSRFTVERSFVAGGDRLLIVRAFAGAERVGYRALRVRIAGP